MKGVIKTPTAPAMGKMAFNFAKSNILNSIPAPLPVLNAIDYIVSNHKYIKKNKGSFLVHPKKISKSLPGVAVPDIINCDYVHYHVIDKLHGSVHDVVVSGIHAMNFFHMLF